MNTFKPGLFPVTLSKMEINTMYHFSRAGRICTAIRRENGFYTWAELSSADVGSGGARELTEWAKGAVN